MKRPLVGTCLAALVISGVACGGADDTVPSTTTGAGAGGATSSTSSSTAGAAGEGGTTTTTTSSTTTTTTSSPPCDPAVPPKILATGAAGLLLRGWVVTPDQAFAGEVLISGDTITCVAPSCPASGATVVDTGGILFPGLIDAHNHILFDIFDETHWSPQASYQNHNQWTNEARYSAMVDAKQYLNGEGTSPVDLGCEMNKYGELKGLVAGTTSIVGAANPANRACYGSLARTVDQSGNDLGADKIQVATLFPSTSSADGVCTNLSSGKTDAYVIHIGEGIDQVARGELEELRTVTSTDGCLVQAKTTIVHGAAFGAAEMDVLAQNHMSLVWSPRSNVFLYGAGADLSRTADIPLARSKGINVALAPDWSLGGSQNLLDELRFADQVDDAEWGDQLGPRDLVEMVTTNAARALGLDAVIGSLAPGKKADVMVVAGDRCDPYRALIDATSRDVRLVVVGGVVLYGDASLSALGPATPGCEDLDVCGASKFVCVAEASGTATNKLGQSLADIEDALDQALASYDALGLTQWKFSPKTPLVRCAP